MGFRYLNSIAAQHNLQDFLELVDLAVGAARTRGMCFCCRTGCGSRIR